MACLKFDSLRFTNIALLVLVLVLSLTGVYGLFWTFNGWVFTVHRAAGWGLFALLPWKVGISLRSLRRGLKPNLDRGVAIVVSLFLSIVTLLVLALGLLWNWRFGPEEYWLRQTAVSWHWMLALGLLAPLAVHVWRRWPRPKRVDFVSRRAVMRLLAVGLLSALGYGLAETLARQRERTNTPRRFSGSRLASQFSGNLFPVTHSVPAQREQIDPQTWQLSVSASGNTPLVLTYPELLALPASEKTATLDCTLGWYTHQVWRGVPLVDLLEQAGASSEPVGVRLESVTGYAKILPYAEAKDVLLATHVGGETLDPSHGFPVRAVVPSRRGWFWIKWLAKVEAVDFLEEIDVQSS